MRKILVFLIALTLIGVQIPAVLAQGEATPPASPPSMEEFIQQIEQTFLLRPAQAAKQGRGHDHPVR